MTSVKAALFVFQAMYFSVLAMGNTLIDIVKTSFRPCYGPQHCGAVQTNNKIKYFKLILPFGF